MRSSSNLLSWTRNSSGQTDSFQTNFDYWYIKDYFVSLFVSFDSESKVFWNLSGLAVKYISISLLDFITFDRCDNDNIIGNNCNAKQPRSESIII